MFAARINDDWADVILCEMDKRGYLRGLSDGFSTAWITEIAPVSTLSPQIHQVHVNGWVLENGDVFVQTLVNLKQPAGDFQQRCGYVVYRTGKDGLQELVRAEVTSYNNTLSIKDQRTAHEESNTIDDRWIESIQTAFADWGLEFHQTTDVNGKGFANVRLTPSDKGYIGYWGTDAPPVRFDYNDILAKGRAHYIAPKVTEGSTIAALIEDFEAAGFAVTQVERNERDAWNGDPAYVRYTFAERGRSTLKVDIRTEDDVIFRLIIEDPITRGTLYKSAGAVGQLDVSNGMRYLYTGILKMPTLGLSQDAIDSMLAYDIGWTEQISDVKEYGVKGYASADGISAVFHRYFWRVGSEYVGCELVLTIDR